MGEQVKYFTLDGEFLKELPEPTEPPATVPGFSKRRAYWALSSAVLLLALGSIVVISLL